MSRGSVSRGSVTGGMCPWGICPRGYMSEGALSCHLGGYFVAFNICYERRGFVLFWSQGMSSFIK